MSLFLECLGYAARTKFAFVNFVSCITNVTSFEKFLLSAILIERLNVIVHNKDRFTLGRETFYNR
jgi:hypothetical protein